MTNAQIPHDLAQIGLGVKGRRNGSQQYFDVAVTNHSPYPLSHVRLGIEFTDERNFNTPRSSLGIVHWVYSGLKSLASSDIYTKKAAYGFTFYQKKYLPPELQKDRPDDPLTSTQIYQLHCLAPGQSRVMTIPCDPLAKYRIGTYMECRIPGDRTSRTVPLAPVSVGRSLSGKLYKLWMDNVIWVGLAALGLGSYGIYVACGTDNTLRPSHRYVGSSEKSPPPPQLPKYPNTSGQTYHIKSDQKAFTAKVEDSKVGLSGSTRSVVICSLKKGTAFRSLSNIELQSTYSGKTEQMVYAVRGQFKSNDLVCRTVQGKEVSLGQLSKGELDQYLRAISVPIDNTLELVTAAQNVRSVRRKVLGVMNTL